VMAGQVVRRKEGRGSLRIYVYCAIRDFIV